MDFSELLDAKRAEAVEELRVAFAELESGEGLTRFVGGHGIQSRVFEFEWSDPALEFRSESRTPAFFRTRRRRRRTTRRSARRYGWPYFC